MGAGYTKKLEAMGLYTMDDIARCSLGKPTDFYNEDTLYDVFGVNAEPIARELHENGIFWFSLSRPSLSTGFAPVELFTKSRTTQNMCINGNEYCAEIEKLTVAAGLFCRKMDGRFCRKKPDTDVRRAGRIDVAGVFCRTREGRGQSRSLH